MYLADEGWGQQQMGASSAMSDVLFAVLTIISIIDSRLQSHSAE